MLALKGVTKTHRAGKIETAALASCDLHIQSGEFVAIMGPSGSGKTTLLNIAGLLERPDSGTITIDGVETGVMQDSEASRFRNTKIGFIFQSFNLLPDLDVRQNIMLPLRFKGIARARREEIVLEVADRFGLLSRLSHYPSQLSGGQQQRVAIARALAGQPLLLLADEPTGNLDSAMALEVLSIIEEVNAGGTTVLVVTHDEAIAKRAQRIIRVVDGRLAASQQ